MRLTRESARAAHACYSYARIADLVPEQGLTPAEVASLDIPYRDRHWALVHAMIPPSSNRVLREHAVWCARQALRLVESPDHRSVSACDVAERFARGEATEEELAAAWTAARDAARDAAWDAASAAARDAAWDAAWAAASAAARAAAWTAAWAAARDAAWDAAWDAARDAAWDAASAAAWAAQLADLVSRLEASCPE